MGNIKEYIKKYGDISFAEKPFNEADNVALCFMFYMPLDQIVSDSFDEIPTPYTYACDRLFAARGNKHKPVGLVLTKHISEAMMLMTEYKRFKEMKIIGCKHVFEKNPDTQFDAVTFLLPTGEVVVLYKGTDDSLRGWKEDFDIFFKENIPSQNLAVEYIETVASKYDGDIIVCGHSKGGYLAQYGAMYCSKETRDRIKCIYNNDGPGFKDYSFLESEEYKEILPKYKHFVPQASLIGMLLCHDEDYTVIKSDKLLGPMEHDLITWQFDGDELVKLEELSSLGKLNDLAIYHLIQGLSDEQKASFDAVLTNSLDGTQKVGLLDFAADIPGAVRGVKDTSDLVDDDSKKVAKSIIKNILPVLKTTLDEFSKGDIKSVKDR